MNETHKNISDEKARKQMIKDRDLILKGAVEAVAKEEGVSVKQVQVVESTHTKKNWWGKVIEIETVYKFRIQP